MDEIVNAPSLEPFKNLTGEQFVRGAIEDMEKYKLPDYALEDYLASYAGPRFWDAMAFVRDYPQSLPRLAKRLSEITVPARLPSVGTIRSFRSPTRRVCTRIAEEQARCSRLRTFRLGRRGRGVREVCLRLHSRWLRQL